MDRGFLPIWRKLEDNPVWSDNTLLAMWVRLLFKASYKEEVIYLGNNRVEKGVGDIITSIPKLSQYLKIKQTTMLRKLKVLETERMLVRKAERMYTRITICNYEEYRQAFIEGGKVVGKESGTQTERERKGSGKVTETVKEVKEVKVSKNKTSGNGEDADFNLWWSHFPKKVGKEPAYKAWLKKIKEGVLPPVLEVIDAIEKQKDSGQLGSEKRYMPKPATWINAHSWEDEIYEPEHTESGKDKDNPLDYGRSVQEIFSHDMERYDKMLLERVGPDEFDEIMNDKVRRHVEYNKIIDEEWERSKMLREKETAGDG